MQNETDILNELREISPLLAGMSKTNVFRVPDSYFNSLAGQILSRIKQQQPLSVYNDDLSFSPLLQSLKEKNVFEVPDGYFEQFASGMVSRVQPGKTRVVFMRSFFKYAVAAVFTGVLALGVVKFNQPVNTKLDATVLAGQQISKDHKFDQEFDKVADDDIIKYLEANGENVDAQMVASKTLDENELPSQDDYLNDDKALDKYLENVNIE